MPCNVEQRCRIVDRLGNRGCYLYIRRCSLSAKMFLQSLISQYTLATCISPNLSFCFPQSPPYQATHLRNELRLNRSKASQLTEQGKELSFLVLPLTPLTSTSTDKFKGGTNHQLDLQQTDNLGTQSTDNGVVPNLRWRFSDARTRIFNGGWTREQIVSDLPSSHDIAGAQQHLKKGATREMHWHRVVCSFLSLLILDRVVLEMRAKLTEIG